MLLYSCHTNARHRNILKTPRYLDTVVVQGTHKSFIRSDNRKQLKLCALKILSNTGFICPDSLTRVLWATFLRHSLRKTHLVKTKSALETNLFLSMTCVYAQVDYLEFLSSPFSHQENTENNDNKLCPVIPRHIWTVFAVTQAEGSKLSAWMTRNRSPGPQLVLCHAPDGTLMKPEESVTQIILHWKFKLDLRCSALLKQCKAAFRVSCV